MRKREQEKDIHPGFQVVFNAQKLRKEIGTCAEAGREGKYEFTGAQARHAFALAQKLDQGLHKNRMMLVFNPSEESDGYNVHLVHKGEHDIDAIRAMVNEKERSGLLVDWYQELYKAIQMDKRDNAAQLFFEMMGPMGIDPYAEEQRELDIFFSYRDDPEHPVHVALGDARDVAERIFRQIHDPEEKGVELEIDEADGLLHALWSVIGSVDEDAVDDYRLYSPDQARKQSVLWPWT